MSRMDIIRGLRSRGYLPHARGPLTTQFITIRLADAVPLREHIEMRRSSVGSDYIRSHDEILDQGLGGCVLATESAALAFEVVLLGWLGQQAELPAWVVMPNHVHLILVIPDGRTIGELIGHLKGASARAINSDLGGSGRLWQREYFDRELRNDKELGDAWHYIEMNPVRAGLCAAPEDWRYSSAWWRAIPPLRQDDGI